MPLGGAPIPILRIFDEAKAREFYCEFLGFAVDWEHRFEDGLPLPDMVTASGSGLDPHISPASAYAQAPRVAKLSNMAEGDLWKLIAQHVEGRTFSVLGEPRVNVRRINLSLDALTPAPPPAPTGK
jgi:catechol 2,3-dioxygenase-like lactoylglutathione lyase family enzyme